MLLQENVWDAHGWLTGGSLGFHLGRAHLLSTTSTIFVHDFGRTHSDTPWAFKPFFLCELITLVISCCVEKQSVVYVKHHDVLPLTCLARMLSRNFITGMTKAQDLSRQRKSLLQYTKFQVDIFL